MRPIDADREIKKLKKMVVEGETFTIAVEFAKLILRNAPTVDIKPVRHGRWKPYPIVKECWQCSKCGILRFGESNYCPNCGAKMDGESDE